jgi:hypothetical protein
MNYVPCFSKSGIRILPILFFIITALSFHSDAQAPAKKTGGPSGSRSKVEQELVRLETGFFEAWKAKDQNYLRDHMTANAVFWGDSGTFSREQGLAEEQASAKVCNVEGYALSDFGVLALNSGAYLLTYHAEQYATCNGDKAPVHVNGSSIYVFKSGRWQAIYRAEVPFKNQS